LTGLRAAPAAIICGANVQIYPVLFTRHVSSNLQAVLVAYVLTHLITNVAATHTDAHVPQSHACFAPGRYPQNMPQMGWAQYVLSRLILAVAQQPIVSVCMA